MDNQRTSATTYSATQADGSALPEGVTVDPESGQISRDLPEGVDRLQIQVTAQDVDTTRTMTITVEAESEARGSQGTNEGDQAAIQGMTPFSEQLAEAAERELSYGDRLVAALEGVA